MRELATALSPSSTRSHASAVPLWCMASAALIAAGASMSGGVAKAQSPNGSPDGAVVFNQNGCLVCHGRFGDGGFGTRLAGDPMVAVPQFVAARIIIGSSAGMPEFGTRLSDQQITAVANYIRNSWGNDYGAIDPKIVADIRGAMNKAEQTAARVTNTQQTPQR